VILKLFSLRICGVRGRLVGAGAGQVARESQ
jgi:hypothetical protein